ncbi:hypothetical protein ES703_114667 [subsurface metagenome]
MEGLSGDRETDCFCERSSQITTTAITMAITTKAGMKSFFNPSVTVISLEVIGFLLGIILSDAGIPFSILSSSGCTSPALWYLFSLSFSMHLNITLLRSSGIWALNSRDL